MLCKCIHLAHFFYKAKISRKWKLVTIVFKYSSIVYSSYGIASCDLLIVHFKSDCGIRGEHWRAYAILFIRYIGRLLLFYKSDILEDIYNYIYQIWRKTFTILYQISWKAFAILYVRYLGMRFDILSINQMSKKPIAILCIRYLWRHLLFYISYIYNRSCGYELLFCAIIIIGIFSIWQHFSFQVSSQFWQLISCNYLASTINQLHLPLSGYV